MKVYLAILISVVFIGKNSHAQAPNTNLARVLERFANREQGNPSANLFVHTDKTLYTNNETIWFAAYLQHNRGVGIEGHNTLAVSLQNLESGKVNNTELYVMAGGLASGSMLIPDSIPEGNYRFFGYTNIVARDGKPIEIFSQPLTIKSTLETKFSASLTLLDTGQTFIGSRRIMLRIAGLPINKKGIYAPANVSYQLGRGQEFRLQSDSNGQVIVNFDPDTLKLAEHFISVLVAYRGEAKHLTLALPPKDTKVVSLQFFPEGGKLVHGLESEVGFEAKSLLGRPLGIRAVLFENNMPIDTVESAVSGMGSFKLMPKSGSNYTLRVYKSNVLARDTVYTLPKPTGNLPVINIAQAVTRDTLDLILKSPAYSNYRVLLHNTHELLASFNVFAGPTGRQVRMALNEVPKGITAITILDTLGNPLAERLFFAHYTDRKLLSATTDKNSYQPREKVTLKLALKQTGVKVEKAIVSVAAVQANRIELPKFRDMESYSYLEHELGSLPLSVGGIPYYDRKYMEDLLLVKGWRRFVWEPEKWPSVSDTASLYNSLYLEGSVTKNRKELTRQVSLTMMMDTVFRVVNLDEKGNFLLEDERSLREAGKKLYFMVNQKDKELYRISFQNPFEKTSTMLDRYLPNESNGIGIIASSPYTKIDNGSNKAIKLKTVEINNRKDNFLSQTAVNKCGDYVCVGNYLNCYLKDHGPRDLGSRSPIRGKMYFHRIGGDVISKPYQGCVFDDPKNGPIFSFQGRHFAREFYVDNYSKVDEADVRLQSTIYWQPLVELSSNKSTELTFYTSDLKAPYRIVVQGLSEKQVVTGGGTFKVE